MRLIISIVGAVLAALGLLWILQGTNIISGGFMAGQMQYALLGAVFFIIGIGLFAFINRRAAAKPGPRA